MLCHASRLTKSALNYESDCFNQKGIFLLSVMISLKRLQSAT
jgi:hypothetical protein